MSRFDRKALERVWGRLLRTPHLPAPSPQSPASSPTKPVQETAPRPSWEAHAALMASHQSYPGWTFCKFGARGPTKHDLAEVQGLVRAPFGAWWAPFLCVDASLGHKTTRGLACVEHTASGMAIGVFADMDLAVEAAEVAMRMADWTGFDINQAGSMELVHRVRSAWAAIGIGFHSQFHARVMVHGEVPEGSPHIGIFMKAPIEQQQPERLS